jgi:hypothetical protein
MQAWHEVTSTYRYKELPGKGKRMKALLVSVVLLSCLVNASANPLVGIAERIIRTNTNNGFEQSGLLSSVRDAKAPTKLIVVISGYPGVTRPQIDAAGNVKTRQNGNFLVRSRFYLVSESTASLLIDCRSDFDLVCPDEYQASASRASDIAVLVEEAKRFLPSIEQVWAVSTSRGVITTASLLKHGGSLYSGIIHTAGTYGKARDQGLDFGPFNIPQFIFHHKNDPCPVTYFRDAQKLAEQWKISLVTVSGGAGFRGDPCQAFTQHGFMGREEKVATAIRTLVERGFWDGREID